MSDESSGDKGEDSQTQDGSKTDEIVRTLGKSGLVIFVGTFLEMGISFLAKLIVARSLLSFGYGEVAIGLTVLTVLAIFTRLGLDSGVARIAPRYEGTDRRDIYLTIYSLIALSTLAGATGLLLLATPLAEFFGNPEIAPVFRVIAVGIPSIPLMRISIGVVRAEGKSAPKVVVQNLAHPITRIGFVAAVALTGATPTRIAIAYVASHWFAALLATGFALRASNIFHISGRWNPRFREVLRFSLPLMLSASMAFVMGNTDNLMIQYFYNSRDVGIYDIAYTLGQTLTIALGAFGFLFLPNVSKLHAEERWDEIHHLYQLVTKWIIFITLPGFLLLAVFPNALLQNTFGAGYTDGAQVLVIIAMAYFVRAGMGPNSGLLEAVGETDYILRGNVVAAVANVILNFLLLPIFGIIGAAVASFTSYTALNLLYSYRLWRISGLVPMNKHAIAPAAVFAVGGGLAGMLIKNMVDLTANPVLLVGIALVAGVCYVITILGLGGIESGDVMLVNSAEDRFGIDLEPIKAIARKLL